VVWGIFGAYTKDSLGYGGSQGGGRGGRTFLMALIAEVISLIEPMGGVAIRVRSSQRWRREYQHCCRWMVSSKAGVEATKEHWGK